MSAAAALLVAAALQGPATLAEARRTAAESTTAAAALYDALPPAVAANDRVRLERADLALHLDAAPPADLPTSGPGDRAYAAVIRVEALINVGKYVAAEAAAREALAAAQAAPPETRDLFGALMDERAGGDLVQALQAVGKLDEARRRAEVLARAAETPYPGEPATRGVTAEGALGAVMFQQGQAAEGWPHMRRSAELAVARLPPRDSIRQAAVNNAAVAARGVVGGAEARRWTDQLLADCPAGASGCDRATALVSRGMLDREAGDRFGAERDFSEAAVIRSATLAPSDPRIAEPLNDLASLLLFRGATAEALKTQARAVKIMDAGYGRDAAATAQARYNLVDMLVGAGRPDTALREAAAAPGPDAAPEARALGLGSQALANLAAGRSGDALRTADAAVALTTPVGPSNTAAAQAVRRVRLRALLALDRTTEAETVQVELLDMARRRFGGGRVEEAGALLGLARLRLEKGEPGLAREAAAAAREALPVWSPIAAPLTVEAVLAPHAGALRDQAVAVELAARWRLAGGRPDSGEAESAFIVAQALFARGTAEAAELAQSLRDGVPVVTAAYLDREHALQSYGRAGRAWAISLSSSAAEPQARALAAFERAEADVNDADVRLASAAPRLDRLRGGRPSPVAALQSVLKPEEALLTLAVERPGVVHAFLVTQAGLVWRRVEIDTQDLCATTSLFSPAASCARRSAAAQERDVQRGSVRPGSQDYDRRAAYRVWRALLAPLAPRLTGVRTLIEASDDEAARIPLAALVTRPPHGRDASPRDRRKTAWLLDRWAVEVLPAPALLPLLRRGGQPTREAGFLGVGAPCLAACGAVGDLAALPPLPGARLELERLAGGATGPARLLLGVDATREEVLGADVTRTGLVVFATHGLGAEGGGAGEAALALTPEPQRPASARLTAADIAGRWTLPGSRVVLSACRTLDLEAARDVMDGLPRAFLASGARSVLVSAGQVPDRAAAELTRAALSPGPLAAALRTEALRLKADPASPSNSEPRTWAMFAVIGDG